MLGLAAQADVIALSQSPDDSRKVFPLWDIK
jgi:hypothetical protein